MATPRFSRQFMATRAPVHTSGSAHPPAPESARALSKNERGFIRATPSIPAPVNSKIRRPTSSDCATAYRTRSSNSQNWRSSDSELTSMASHARTHSDAMPSRVRLPIHAASFARCDSPCCPQRGVLPHRGREAMPHDLKFKMAFRNGSHCTASHRRGAAPRHDDGFTPCRATPSHRFDHSAFSDIIMDSQPMGFAAEYS